MRTPDSGSSDTGTADEWQSGSLRYPSTSDKRNHLATCIESGTRRMPLQLQIASETPACSSDTPVGPSLNSGKFTLLSQPGKHLGSNRVNTALGVAQHAPSFCRSNPDPTVTLITCGISLGVSLIAYTVAAETAGMDRDIEREADRAAWDRLANSGYCAGRIMKTAFDELSKLTPEGQGGDIFSTHPRDRKSVV